MPHASANPNMIWIPGGTFRMGSDKHYPEEAPVHRVTVDGFWIDRTPVTNGEFRKFVNTTGYVTFAEIPPHPKDYPGALPHMLKAASLVFTSPKHAVDTRDWSQWWNFKFGANWPRPYGKRSSISGLDDHPVVHVAFATPRLTRNGSTRSCRRKPSVISRRAAGLTVPSSPGPTSSRPAANT
jgi:formylglycine-generating enzyme required for sulfatase activity